ncbi:hypothetical protein MB02_08965 [Croceicoccus estronivorus]|uniref:Lrp/AsnC family transcriptional regulator n=1 Tax=Croceicoccus estronivorus TaxID=1172626 RepID=UPI0008358F63|nr:Lrp/AsnC family transcriptional regulator [Croceicoccus estronivorus]OCC23937.1 hypothetical protein MB02_08965 [Croceicoccus estronivorus]
MTDFELDELDRRILDELGQDARLSNRSIAQRLGLVEGTIRARIRRMQQRDVLRFTAITDNRQHGRPRMCFIGIHTTTSTVRTIARALAAIPEMRSVIVTLGRFNLLAIGLFTDLDAMMQVIDQQITSLEGVLKVETSVVIKSIKYNERMAKLSVR